MLRIRCILNDVRCYVQLVSLYWVVCIYDHQESVTKCDIVRPGTWSDDLNSTGSDWSGIFSSREDSVENIRFQLPNVVVGLGCPVARTWCCLRRPCGCRTRVVFDLAGFNIVIRLLRSSEIFMEFPQTCNLTGFTPWNARFTASNSIAGWAPWSDLKRCPFRTTTTLHDAMLDAMLQIWIKWCPRFCHEIGWNG